MILEITIILGSMGIILGLILSIVSNKFAVWKDPVIGKIEKELPAINCGACGYPGCEPYAKVVAEGGKTNLCTPGGPELAVKLSQIMGTEPEEFVSMVAKLHCDGGIKEAGMKFDYDGINTCKAAKIVNNGFKVCNHSCLGLGDCVEVCPVEACMSMNENGLPEINKETCIGCNKCVAECPCDVLSLVPKDKLVHVKCTSCEKAKRVVKACTVGCIGCDLCVKVCPDDAIHVINNLAIIDYDKCTNCKKCVPVCPRNIIELEPEPPKPEVDGEEGAEEAEA